MSGRAPSTKGKRGERELVNRLRAAGLDAERARGSDGRALGATADVDVIAAGMHAQVKRRKRLAREILPPDGADLTFVRADNQPWYAIVPLDVLIELLGGDSQ